MKTKQNHFVSSRNNFSFKTMLPFKSVNEIIATGLQPQRRNLWDRWDQRSQKDKFGKEQSQFSTDTGSFSQSTALGQLDFFVTSQRQSEIITALKHLSDSVQSLETANLKVEALLHQVLDKCHAIEKNTLQTIEDNRREPVAKERPPQQANSAHIILGVAEDPFTNNELEDSSEDADGMSLSEYLHSHSLQESPESRSVSDQRTMFIPCESEIEVSRKRKAHANDPTSIPPCLRPTEATAGSRGVQPCSQEIDFFSYVEEEDSGYSCDLLEIPRRQAQHSQPNYEDEDF